MIYLYSLIILITIVLSVTFPFLMLFGFFENRKDGNYQFRTWRLLTITCVIFILNGIAFIVSLYGTKDLMVDGTQVAETAVLKNRARLGYTMDNLGVMFPEIVNEQSKECYRAGISNYVEDLWNKSFREEVCKDNMANVAKRCDRIIHLQQENGWWRDYFVKQFCQRDSVVCPNKQEDYFEFARLQVNPTGTPVLDMSVVGYFLGSVWRTAAPAYNSIRQLFQQPDGKGNMPPPPDQQMLTEYHQYLINCSSLKPYPWAAKDAYVITPPRLCFGECP